MWYHPSIHRSERAPSKIVYMGIFMLGHFLISDTFQILSCDFCYSMYPLIICPILEYTGINLSVFLWTPLTVVFRLFKNFTATITVVWCVHVLMVKCSLVYFQSNCLFCNFNSLVFFCGNSPTVLFGFFQNISYY